MTWVLAALVAFDLAAARSEPNLEKRSELALKNADVALTAAREAYNTRDEANFTAALEEVRQSVELSYESLVRSGRNPRNSGSYKRAEQAVQKMIRRLDGLRETVSVFDREAMDPLRAQLASVHEKLLAAIMAKKKK